MEGGENPRALVNDRISHRKSDSCPYSSDRVLRKTDNRMAFSRYAADNTLVLPDHYSVSIFYHRFVQLLFVRISFYYQERSFSPSSILLCLLPCLCFTCSDVQFGIGDVEHIAIFQHDVEWLSIIAFIEKVLII